MVGDQGDALAHEAAQNCIDEAGESILSPSPRLIHGGGDGGVGRGLQEKELNSAKPKYGAHLYGFRRQRAFHAGGYCRIDLAEPAQGGHDYIEGESPVPRR